MCAKICENGNVISNCSCPMEDSRTSNESYELKAKKILLFTFVMIVKSKTFRKSAAKWNANKKRKRTKRRVSTFEFLWSRISDMIIISFGEVIQLWLVHIHHIICVDSFNWEQNFHADSNRTCLCAFLGECGASKVLHFGFEWLKSICLIVAAQKEKKISRADAQASNDERRRRRRKAHESNVVSMATVLLFVSNMLLLLCNSLAHAGCVWVSAL